MRLLRILLSIPKMFYSRSKPELISNSMINIEVFISGELYWVIEKIITRRKY